MMNGLLVLEIIDSSVNDFYRVALLQFCNEQPAVHPLASLPHQISDFLSTFSFVFQCGNVF